MTQLIDCRLPRIDESADSNCVTTPLGFRVKIISDRTEVFSRHMAQGNSYSCSEKFISYIFLMKH